MRVLVTGGAGFIGSQLCRALAFAGHDVLGVDSFNDVLYPAAIKVENARTLERHPGIQFLEHDLRLALPSRIWEGVDCVVNQAAIPGLLPSWTHFSEYLNSNALVVQQLARDALAAKVSHFIHVSTSSVYGTQALGDEQSLLVPSSPYGVSKLAAELIVRTYHQNFGLPMTILRYFSVYGPGQRPDMAYHIFAEQILASQEVTIYGDGKQTRSNTHVVDCLRGTIAAMKQSPRGQTYNIAGGEVVTLLDAVYILSEALGLKPRIRFANRKPGDQDHTKGDWSKASRELGYEPMVPLRDGLLEQAEWHRLGRPAEFTSKWLATCF